jgi:hypothetical protein
VLIVLSQPGTMRKRSAAQAGSGFHACAYRSRAEGAGGAPECRAFAGSARVRDRIRACSLARNG